MLVIVSKVKAMAKAAGLRTSSEFCNSLSEAVQKIVIASAKQAKEAKMGTIKDRHMPEIILQKSSAEDGPEDDNEGEEEEAAEDEEE